MSAHRLLLFSIIRHANVVFNVSLFDFVIYSLYFGCRCVCVSANEQKICFLIEGTFFTVCSFQVQSASLSLASLPFGNSIPCVYVMGYCANAIQKPLVTTMK